MGKILLRKLRPRGKVYVARSYRKSLGVLGAHFVPMIEDFTFYEKNELSLLDLYMKIFKNMI